MTFKTTLLAAIGGLLAVTTLTAPAEARPDHHHSDRGRHWHGPHGRPHWRHREYRHHYRHHGWERHHGFRHHR